MEAYFTVAIAITAILLSLHIHYRIYPKKGTLTAPPPSPADLPSAPNRNKKEGRKSNSSNYRKERQTILVTGGCGLVGTSILQQLQKLEAYTLIGMDLFEPEADSPRKVEGVYYTAGNLCSQSVDEMGDFLNEHQVNGIIHTAGVVSMKDDPDTLISVNHYASTKLLLAAKHHTRCCSAFIVTSSASTVNPGTCDNIDISPCTEPADPFVHPDAFSTDYGRSKAAAELDVCHTNDPDIGFFSLAVRLPGVYGAGDPWIGGPLSRGQLTTLPGRADKKQEMVYVENAAHGHVAAMQTLLLGGKRAATAAGRAYHITNHEPDLTMGAFVSKALLRFPDNPQPQVLGVVVSTLVCLFVEFYYWFTQGNVFAPRHPVWNFTRACLSYMQTAQTFATDGNELIGYEPIFSCDESLDDMKRIVEETYNRKER